MSTATERRDTDATVKGPESFGASWLLFVLFGILVIAAGAMAIGATFIATLMSILVFGILLICGGVFQVISAFLARSWGGFFVHLLVGILELVVGALMVEHPGRAAEAITLMLAVAFIAGGIVRLVSSILNKFTGRAWVFFNGVVTLILGVLIWRQWPESSVWVIGTFVGIELIISGWSWVMIGLMAKAAAPKAAHHVRHESGSPTVTTH